MRILYSGFRFPHHSSSGGYDHIAQKPNTSYITVTGISWERHTKLHMKVLRNTKLRLFDIMTKYLRYSYDITHLIYTEQQLYYPYPRSRKHKIAGTVHLDIYNPSFSRRLCNMKTLDAIVVLKRDYVEPVHGATGVKTIFIPHGFDRPLFKKNISNDIRNNLINTEMINVSVVGCNYRDYNTLDFVIKNTANKNIVFHLIGQKKETIDLFKKYNNVLCYNYLDNNAYYSLLANCDYNFLPLTFATANNVLLEVQSLGIASILPQISGIFDYAADSLHGNIYYNSNDEVLEIVNGLKKGIMQEKLIKYSETFSWSEIFKQLDIFYNNLHEG
jgi:glycosyltransferase involved in cell wall biosynthesis